MLSSRIAAVAAVIALVFAACGGKTVDLDGGLPQEPADASPDVAPEASPPTIDAGGRICPPNCTVGHQCCMGGSCGGLPAPMPSSCCSCLPGEVDSIQCPNDKCGG